jgi:hypothetical protein
VHFIVSGVRNVNALFFMLGWNQYGFHKKRVGTRYAELVFLHPLRSTGHVVHSDASRARNVQALFLCSGGPDTDFTKSTLGHDMSNLCFCIQWHLRVKVHLGPHVGFGGLMTNN